MFDAQVYKKRRNSLRKHLRSGLLLFPGNGESPMNYPANTFPFRQDSSFLYFFGLDFPGLAGIIDVEENRDIIFGNDITLEDVIWMGYQPSLKERAKGAGIKEVQPQAKLQDVVGAVVSQGRKVHYLPPYRQETSTMISALLGIPIPDVKKGASEELIRGVVGLRSVKTGEEVAEIEKALEITREMYLAAMKMTRPGLYERDIFGKVNGISLAHGVKTAFPTILTVNGQILHNHYHGNRMNKGRLLVIDAGSESPRHYASDITRTIPVSGKFSVKQKEIYETVLDAQETAIEAMSPGIYHKEVHLTAARVIAARLKDIGLMKGDVNEAVSQGAHALFFPHGLGHLLGLDVHDMEGLGENYVGYDETVKRSDQFGMAYLRLARKLLPGYVLTVEPGVYFIPALIDKWRGEKKFTDFIDYPRLEAYRDFGGIRIEDDVLITDNGRRVLGRRIPKTVRDVEKTMAG